MARKGCRVLLGFEDECVTEKHRNTINFTTNKIGGKPDWPTEKVPYPLCQLCGLVLPLVVQIYAPLEGSPYHRTLYVFGCVNPNCWNHNGSWQCIRSQTLANGPDTEAVTMTTVNTGSSTDWCDDADDWDDENTANNNEENGNVIGRIESFDQFSDEGDDNGEDSQADIKMGLGNLTLDDRNANWEGEIKGGAGAQEGGAVGRLHSPSATAEIEGEESEVVSIDTPTAPQCNLFALLQEVAPLPASLNSSSDGHLSRPCDAPEFSEYFICVGEEDNLGNSPTITPLSEHVRELLQEYQQNNDDISLSPQQEKGAAIGQGDHLTPEKYEKTLPPHGDKMFHQFLMRIQRNPGQILRYCREPNAELLLHPLNEKQTRCQHCFGELTFELQLLPTLITKLRLKGEGNDIHLEFGTVLVFTCKRNCWSPGDVWRQEKIFVQAEHI